MTSRNTIVAPTTFNLPTLQVPLEMLQARLEQSQFDKDSFDEMSGMLPNYIEQDSPLLAKYKQLVDKVSSDVSTKFASGDTNSALRQLREGKRAIAKEWQPGGIADVLNQRYAQDVAAKKQIEDRFANDLKEGNSINYSLAKSLYQIPDANYNPELKTYNSISAPNVPTYFDVDNELRDWLKSIDPQEYGFSKVQGDYVYTTEGKKYHIREFVPQFMNDPRVQQQLQLNSQFKYMQMSPDERQDLIQTGQATLDSQRAQVAKELETLEANLNSGDKKKVMEAQAALASQGFNVNGSEFGKDDVDGEAGPRTRMALEQMKQVVDKLSSKQFDENALQNALYQEQVTGIGAKALAAKPDSETTKITGSNWRAQEMYKSSLRKKEQDEYLSKVAAMSTSVATPVPNFSLDLNTVEQLIKTTDEALTATKSSLQQQMSSNPELTTTFGTPERAMEFRKALEDNNGDVQKAAEQVGVDVGTMEKAYKIFANPSNRGFSESALNMAETMKSKGQVELQKKELSEIYVKRNGADVAKNFITSRNLAQYGVTPEMLIDNPEEARRRIPETVTQTGTRDGNIRVYRSHPMDDFSKILGSEIQKDFKANTDAYASTISQGLRDNSEQYKGFEKAGAAYLSLPDESGKFNWVDSNGKQVSSKNPVTNLKLENITSAAGKKGQVLVYSGEIKDGDKTKTATRRVYVGSNAEISNAVQNWGLGVASEAINNGDYTQALRAIEIAVGTDDLNRSLVPSTKNQTTFIENIKGVQQITQQNYTTVKGFGSSSNSTELVTFGTPDNPSWAVVQNRGTHMEVLPSITDEGTPAVYSNFDQAARTFKLLQAQSQGLLGQQAAKLKEVPISPVYPFNSND